MLVDFDVLHTYSIFVVIRSVEKVDNFSLFSYRSQLWSRDMIANKELLCECTMYHKH